MLMCALLIAVPVTTESASAAVATNRTAKAKISGWVTVQNGQKKYYKKGQYLKGCKKIEKNYYYFGPKGVMKTCHVFYRKKRACSGTQKRFPIYGS